MTQPPADLGSAAQKTILKVLIDSQILQNFDLYAVTSDSAHLHIVAAWRDDRDEIKLRSQIKTSLSRALNKRFAKRQWFVAKGGQNQVIDEEHLHQLIHCYLPKHAGIYWQHNGQDDDKP